jgi:GMP synthase (glutamine-hydrolysing)
VADTAPRVLVIQHEEDDPPGRVGEWLVEAGCGLRVVRPYAGELLPRDLRGFAGLVVLGGAMSAHDDDAYPWLTPTKGLLREAVATRRPTLGICLGHQLLSVAHGGRVERVASGQQGGSRPLGPRPAADDDPLFAGIRPGSPSVQWNHDIVAVPPPGAIALAETRDGIQVLRIGSAAWGVQSHPEVDAATVESWVKTEVSAGLVAPDDANRWLAEIEAADLESREVWQPIIHRFAQLVLRTREEP